MKSFYMYIYCLNIFLYRIMISTGYNSTSVCKSMFRNNYDVFCGFVILFDLVTGRIGDANSLIITKAFLWKLKFFLDYFENVLLTDDLQLGFEWDLCCSGAIFTLRETNVCFMDRGGTVYAATLDISKAFDSVKHNKLFASLIKAGLPKRIIAMLINWYSKLRVSVRWKPATSSNINIFSRVRQGSSFSPAVLTVCLNIVIINLRFLSVGCNVNGCYICCLMCAHDLILLSATVNELQDMNCCFSTSTELRLQFNCAKSTWP